jgi:hypothetical protein
VAEPHLDDLGGDAAAVALAGEGVAEEVRVDVFFKASVAGGSGGDPPEALVIEVAVDGAREDEGAGLGAEGSVREQSGDEVAGEGDGAGAAAFGLFGVKGAVRLNADGALDPNGRRIRVEVKIVPAEGHELAAAEAGADGGEEEEAPFRGGGGEQTIDLEIVEEDGIRARDPFHADPREVGEQAVVVGEVKDGSQGGEDVVDGLGALGGAFAAGAFGGIGAGEGAAGGGGFTRGGAEIEAEGVDDERGDRVEAERAEAGEEMEVEVAGFVAGVGAGRVPEGEVGGGEGGEGGGSRGVGGDGFGEGERCGVRGAGSSVVFGDELGFGVGGG